MKQCLILLLVVITFHSVLSQSEIDSSDYLEIADSLIIAKKYAKADSFYTLAESLYRKNNNWEKWGKAAFRRRSIANKLRDFEKVLELLEDFEAVVPKEEYMHRAIIHFQRGYTHARLINFPESNSEYKKSLEILNKLPDTLSRAKTYRRVNLCNISINYSRLGDQKSAIKYGDDAFAYCEKIQFQSKLCDLQINKGQFYYYDGQYDEAIEQYNLSFDYCEGNDVAFIHTSLAELYLFREDPVKADSHLEKAKGLLTEESQYYSTIYHRYLFKSGKYEKAKMALKKSLEIMRKNGDTRNLIKELVGSANNFYDSNEKEEAIGMVHEALSLFYSEIDETDIFDRPPKNSKLPYTYIIEAFYFKAKHFRQLYIETDDENLLIEATYYYDLLLSYFDKLKSKYYSSSSKYRMGAYSQKIYSEVIHFFIDQFNIHKNEEHFQNAFSLSQRANSFVLRNAISDRKALEMAGVSRDSTEDYLQLASKVASDNIDSISAVDIFTQFDNYKESLLSNYPSYSKYDKEEEISLAEIQASLDSNSLVMKYYYFDEILTAIGIAKNSIFAENIPFSKHMDTMINVNLDIISQLETNDSISNIYLTNSKNIYETVLGNLLVKYNLKSIKNLTIIPDGPLKKVSFNALAIDVSNDLTNPSNYLISKYSIHYLYYCSQLKNQKDDYASKEGFIGFGIEYEDIFLKELINEFVSNFKDNTDNTRSISLSPLKYADDEVLTTSKILDGASYINADVTLGQVFSTINDYDIIHFSAHAFVYDDEYLNSFIVLNKDDGENYQLRYSDILNLNLDSELVVLSACQTSSGKSVVGEGLMSLSRAFVQSGSNAAIGSYWNAPDYATKELMILFYSNLKNGMTKSEAMQKAQIEYLSNDNISSPTIRNPFFWAPWAVYGSNEPIGMKSPIFEHSLTNYLFIVLAGAMLIFYLVWHYRNKALN